VRRTSFVALVATLMALLGGPVEAEPAARASSAPEIISLPDGFQPEGIARGHGATFFAGSLLNGAIVRGDLRTGEQKVFIPGADGRVAVGLEVDNRNRLWVSGGATGEARVYDADSGQLLRTYTFGDPGTVFINDVVVTQRAAYFTDSLSARLFVVPIGHGGRLGSAGTLDLTGDFEIQPGFNLNGIEASPNGRTLLVIQSNTGLLFSVSAGTGVTREVDLGGASLSFGDGLLRSGRTLYVVRNQLNEIAVVKLGTAYRMGRLVDSLTDPDLDVPTTVAKLGPFLFAVNARFGTPPTPQTEYDIVRVDTH
jgi:hypothetical protein